VGRRRHPMFQVNNLVERERVMRTVADGAKLARSEAGFTRSHALQSVDVAAALVP